MSLTEWCSIQDVGLVSMWMAGYGKRHRTTLEVGRVLAKVTASCVCKNLPDDFPYALPWDNEDITDTRTDEEKEADMMAAIPRLEEALRKMNNKTE